MGRCERQRRRHRYRLPEHCCPCRWQVLRLQYLRETVHQLVPVPNGATIGGGIASANALALVQSSVSRATFPAGFVGTKSARPMSQALVAIDNNKLSGATHFDISKDDTPGRVDHRDEE